MSLSAYGTDVCRGCGRYLPESTWDGECRFCEPNEPDDAPLDEIACDADAIAETYQRPYGVLQAEANKTAARAHLVSTTTMRKEPHPLVDIAVYVGVYVAGVAYLTADAVTRFARRVVRPVRRAQKLRLLRRTE